MARTKITNRSKPKGSTKTKNSKPRTRQRARQPELTSSSSSAPNPRKVQLAKRKKRQRAEDERIRIDLAADAGEDVSSSLTSPPSSSRSSDEEDNGTRRRRTNQRRERELRQPKRYPINPNEEAVGEWLQNGTANPYVKLTRKQMKRMQPCSRIYLKVAKIDPDTQRISKLLPGGVLVRNEFPTYCMLQGINNPKPFSMQFPVCQFYIRRLDLPKITEEYEKNKIYQAVLQQQG